MTDAPAAPRPPAGADDAPQLRPRCPEPNANFISRIFMGWAIPLVRQGWSTPLQDNNLWELRPHEQGASTTEALMSHWRHVERDSAKKLRLQHAIYLSARMSMYLSFVLRVIDLAINALNPVFVNRLLRSIEQSRPRRESLLLCLPLLATGLVKTIIENHFFLSVMRTGMRIRSSLQGLLYDKSLRMSPSARASSSLGQIVNLMQLDTQRIGDFAQTFHTLWFAPSSIIITVALLYVYIGPAALIGLAGTVLTLPLQNYIMLQMMKIRAATVVITDRRVKLMNEVLQGIKAVKMYAWEKPFNDAVQEDRSDEIKKLSQSVWVRSAFMAVMMSLPIVIGVITFAFYVAVFKNKLVVSDIFTGVALLNQLRIPVLMLPMTINAFIDARLGMKRIERFLGLEDAEVSQNIRAGAKATPSGENDTKRPSDDSELNDTRDDTDFDKTTEVDSSSSYSMLSSAPQIRIMDGEFQWSQAAEDPLQIQPKKSLFGSCFPKRTKGKKGEDKPAAAKADANNEPDSDAEKAAPPDSDTAVDLNKYVSLRGSVLNDINVHFKPGELAAVVGHVGSGKSSLFHAILGEMHKVRGNVKVSGTVAYVAQTAWILNGTLRENILFGNSYDEELYKKSIEVSALSHDIEILPAGDMTAIGEKGINLSGGQKQRISIARAVYAQADVYLFDDPLSALDAHVSKFVFDRCISNQGELRGKLRVLVTNQTHCLPQCDNVLFLDAGQVRARGTYAALSTNEAFRALLSEDQSDEEAKSDDESKAKMEEPKALLKTEPTMLLDGAGKAPAKDDGKKAGSNLIEKEERVTGNVILNTYVNYAKACGGVLPFSLLLIFWAVVAALSLVVQWWLSYWAEQEAVNPGRRGLVFYLGIYFGLAIGYAILTFLRSAFYLNLALVASKSLHNNMLDAVLRAPLTFFDTTPIGRILSRFSRDMQAMDELVPQFFQQMMTTTLQLLVTYAFIGVLLPLFLVAAIPVTVFYYLFQRFFNRTSVELKRLDSISKSPIYAHFSETLGGLSTLRAYGKQEQFRTMNMEAIDINQRAYFSWLVTNRWFSLFLELVGSVLVFATAVFGVLASERQFSGNIALVLTFALQVTSILGFSVRSMTELEGQMNSVERADYYAKQLPREAPAEMDPGAPDAWPSEGGITIDDVEMRYRDGLPLVLRGVKAEIKGGEKVGVVGRTGSGKSSLMVALLRIVELSGGKITVDGQDLTQMGLNDIRKRMTIIPQDPVMFSGTIRFNLDPFGEHSDASLWDALDKSHLKEFVAGFEAGLDAPVSEYGENLSAGQRQVVCLTRALLRRSKILILDEASSALDMETDRLIQETIRTHMADATILTIAHRLFTLADYDRILVMDDGQAVEFDEPERLLDVEGGHLHGLVQALGPSGSQQFRRLVSQRSQRTQAPQR